MDETEKVLCLSFPARCDASPAFEPSKETLDLPSTLVAAQLAVILLARAIGFRWGNEIDTSHLLQSFLECVAVPSFVCDQSRRQSLHESSVESSLGEHTVESISSCNMDSEWKTMAVCHCHEFRRIPSPAFADAGPPFSPARRYRR